MAARFPCEWPHRETLNWTLRQRDVQPETYKNFETCYFVHSPFQRVYQKRNQILLQSELESISANSPWQVHARPQWPFQLPRDVIGTRRE